MSCEQAISAVVRLLQEHVSAHGGPPEVANRITGPHGLAARIVDTLGAALGAPSQPEDRRPRYGDPTIYECQWEIASTIDGEQRLRVCGYVQRGPGTCPYPHATSDREPVALTPIFTRAPSQETGELERLREAAQALIDALDRGRFSSDIDTAWVKVYEAAECLRSSLFSNQPEGE